MSTNVNSHIAEHVQRAIYQFLIEKHVAPNKLINPIALLPLFNQFQRENVVAVLTAMEARGEIEGIQQRVALRLLEAGYIAAHNLRD